MNPSSLNSALADRYVVEREIGRGGMATVFLARDLRHDRPVALKVLNPELGAVLGVERFLSEIRVTANLQHPNLLPLFDSGEADGLLFYVMPFVEGETLRHRIDREKQLPVDESVRMAIAVANALEYAHSHGVIHRDLKPENILLQQGEPVVADFGIALAVSNAGGTRVTQTGISLGTPQYMSPEQAMGDRVIDRRSDVYSLAAVLFELLAGEPPHSGTSGQAIIAKLMTEAPVRLTLRRPSVPPHVEAAVHRGLEKLPADRWNTAREFADALRGVGVVTTMQAVVHGRRPMRWLPAGIAIAATVVAIGEGVMLRRQPAPSNPVTLRFPFTTPDSERFLPATPAVPFAISPDGRRIAYVGAAPGVGTRVYVRGLDDMQSHGLASEGRPLSPTFSPDGKWVAMVFPDRIVKTPVDGGPLTTLRVLNGAQNAGMSWFDPDTIISSVGGVLEAMPVGGSAPVVLSHPDTARGEMQQWGPRVINRRFVGYISLGSSGIATNKVAILDRKTGRTIISPHFGTTILGTFDDKLVWVMTSGSVVIATVGSDGTLGAPRLVLEDVLVRPGGAAKAVMSADGSLIYQRGVAVSQLVVVDDHGEKTPFSVEPRAFAHPRWSPDGARVAVAIGRTGGADIWLIDARTKVLTKLTNDGGSAENPAWTPDSKRIIYRSIRPGGTKLKWIAADGSDAGSELPTVVDPYSGSLSHDGKWLVYRTSDASGAFRDIFRAPMTGDRTSQPILTGPLSEITASLSPDDKWMLYATDRGGVLDVYVRPFEGGTAEKISTSGGSEPVWSHDGHSIFYRDGRSIIEATLTGSPPTVANRRTVAEGPYITDAGYGNYDVAPDGKHFLMLESADRQAETIIVHNWVAELRRGLQSAR